MPVLQVLPRKRAHTCSLNTEGKLTISAKVLETLGWEHGTSISINYLLTPLTLLLQKVADESGFKLMRRASTSSSNPAGLLSCTAFARSTLKPRIILPLKRLTPIFLRRKDYGLALMLEPIQWMQEEFSQAGRQNIAPGVSGVYQLLSYSGEVLRIGQGKINNRIAQYLKDDTYIKSVYTIGYLPLADKEESELLEHILLTSYETVNRKLPVFNLLRS